MNTICKNFLSGVRVLSLKCTYSLNSSIARNRFYQSDLSLNKLYPNSQLKLYTPAPPTITKDGKFSGYIPVNQLDITYCRSTGPGGQHVNCVNTKVDVRFKLSIAEWIPEKTREKLLIGLKNKINKDGYFVIKSDITRSQQMNLADALEKLRSVIRQYEIETPVVAEETIEKIRRRQERAARERLLEKRKRSQTKADRQGPLDMF